MVNRAYCQGSRMIAGAETNVGKVLPHSSKKQYLGTPAVGVANSKLDFISGRQKFRNIPSTVSEWHYESPAFSIFFWKMNSDQADQILHDFPSPYKRLNQKHGSIIFASRIGSTFHDQNLRYDYR